MLAEVPTPTYIIQKRYGENGRGTEVVYFLRCLWHIINDPKSDLVIHWHPTENNRFVVVDEELITDFLKTYDGFKANWMTFRRSMYFYGFKKVKSVWFHKDLDKTNEECLRKIKRVSRSKKRAETLEQLRNRYMQIMMQQMQHIQTHNQLMSLTPQGFSPPDNSSPNTMMQQNAFKVEQPHLAPLQMGNPSDTANMPYGGVVQYMTPPNFPSLSGLPPLTSLTTSSYSPLEFNDVNINMNHQSN